MRFSAVIFDFDGTLCDTGPGIMNSAAYALEAYGFEVPREPGARRWYKNTESATTAPFSMRACFTGVL